MIGGTNQLKAVSFLGGPAAAPASKARAGNRSRTLEGLFILLHGNTKRDYKEESSISLVNCFFRNFALGRAFEPSVITGPRPS